MKGSPAWQEARRALLIKSAIDEVEANCRHGIAIGRAIKSIAQKYRRKSLGRGRKLRLSRKTLERIWYAFRETRDSHVFELHYKPGNPAVKVDPLLARAVAMCCLSSGVTISQALVEMQDGLPSSPRLSLRAIYRALPARKIARCVATERRFAAERAKTEARHADFIARLKREILSEL